MLSFFFNTSGRPLIRRFFLPTRHLCVGVKLGCQFQVILWLILQFIGQWSFRMFAFKVLLVCFWIWHLRLWYLYLPLYKQSYHCHDHLCRRHHLGHHHSRHRSLPTLKNILTHRALPGEGGLCGLFLIWPTSFCQLLSLLLSLLLGLDFLLSSCHFVVGF